MNQPTLVYGIGATKAGTSWLHIYLSRHPETYFRAVKELHYFDTLDRPQWRDRVPLERLLALAAKRETVGDFRKRRIDDQIVDFTAWQEMLFKATPDHSKYLSYLESGLQDEKVVGDFTPSYGMLPAEVLAQIVALPRLTKFIYIMRDPLDRLWSNIRMAAGRLGARGAEFFGACSDILNQVLDGSHKDIIDRSNYVSVLKGLDKVVDPKNVLIQFFENMFNHDATRRITDFLGIAPFSWRFDKIIHGGTQQDMNDTQRQRALEWLRPQYDYVMRRFSGQVPGQWHAQLNEV